MREIIFLLVLITINNKFSRVENILFERDAFVEVILKCPDYVRNQLIQ